MKKSLVFWVTLLWVAGCGAKNTRPTSYQAEIVESLDGNRVRVRAVGVGDHTQEAIADGYRAAVYRVSQDLVQSPDERVAFEGVADEIYANANKYVERYEIKSRRKEPHADVKLNLDIVVNRRLLADDLVALGVIKAQRDLLTELRNPSIVVLPDAKIDGTAWRQFAIDHVASYLTARKFEVLDAGQVAKLDLAAARTQGAGGISTDPQAAIALEIGGDIYVVFDVSVDRGAVGRDGTLKATANVRAFETTTARSVGSETGFSREYATTAGAEQKAIAEALSDAIDKLMIKVMAYWKDDTVKGFQYLVQVRGNFGGDDGERVSRAMYEAVKAVAGANFKENVATAQTLNYQVWYKGDNRELLYALQDKFQPVTNKKLRSLSNNRKMLQLQVE